MLPPNRLFDLMILEERAGGRALPPFARLIKGTPVREEQRCIPYLIIVGTIPRILWSRADP